MQSNLDFILKRLTRLAAVAVVTAAVISTSRADALTWALPGGGDWDITSSNWNPGPTTFTDGGGDSVTFNNTAGGTITIAPNMTPISTTVSATSGTYIFSGGPIDGGSLVKSGAGILRLNSANSFGGGTTFGTSGGVLDVRAAGALGSGTINYNGGKLEFRTVSQTLSNPIVVGSGVSGGNNDHIVPYVTTTFAGGISIASGSTLRLGFSNGALGILAAPTTGNGNLEIARIGLAMNNANQIPAGNLNIGSIGGELILDGVSWDDFLAARPNGYGSGAGQWRLGGQAGFGARSEPLVITGVGAVGGGADAKTWFNGDRNLGASYSGTTARAYANEMVTVQVDTELTARRDWRSTVPGGPGLTGTHNAAKVNRFEGDITDQVAAGTGLNRGTLRFFGDFSADELVLAGSNNWTGSYYQNGLYGTHGSGSQNSLNTGMGGMLVYCNSGDVALVQFDGQGSLPTGNAGGDAWLAGVSRYNGSSGFMLAAKTGGETYQLPAGQRFLLGANNGGTVGVLGASGPVGSSATLRDSTVCLQSGLSTDTAILDVPVRGNMAFNLGVPGAGNTGAVLFQPTWDWDGDYVDSTIGGAATVVQNSAASRTIRVRGDGTAVLGHVAYTQLGGTGDTSSQFRWQVGVLTNNTFNGALRETGTDIGTSTAAFPLALSGGVLELGAADFLRSTGSGAGQVYMLYGGGFSAFGGDRTVTLNGGANLTWGTTGIGFVHDSYALIFGSRTADSTVEFTNYLNLNGGTRQIMVVRGVGDAPEVKLSGVVSNGNLRLVQAKIADGSLIPTGTLELAGNNNFFTGAVAVEAGTLRVTGSIANSASAVTVWAGATLEGTGTILRPISLNAGATLAPGTSVGTLTVGSLSMVAGSIFEVEIDGVGVAGTDYDQLVVTGNAGLQLGGATLALTFGTGFTAQFGDAVFIIDNAGTGSTLGTFQFAEGEVIGKFNGRPWIITYLADYGTLALSGGKDVALYAIPEPASLALLALAGLAAGRRRPGCGKNTMPANNGRQQ